MADGKIEIDLELNDSGAAQKGKKAGDDIAKGVESGLKNVGKSADSAAKDTEKSFKNAADSAKSSFSDVGSAAKDGFSDVGDAAKTAAGDASSAFENVPSDASGAFSDVSSEAKTGFDGVTDAAQTAASDTASAFDGVGDEIAADLDDVGDKADGLFGTGIPASTAIAAGAVGAVTAKVIDLGKKAVDTGMEFDSSMAQVAATMGVSVDEVQNLRDFAQEMGESTAFSASQSAEALNFMALAGYDAETSMRVLPTVLNLAAAGSMDLATASDMVTDAQSALGLSVEDAEVMVDQMAKTSSKTNTSVSQLGDAFLTVGGTAKNLKGGTAELSQMLGLLADNGVKGAEGGTALRNVILSLSAPTDKAAGSIKSLGLEVFDAEGNMRSMPDIFNDMNAALSTMSQQERTEVLNNIFNKVDLKSVNALLGTSADRFNEVADAIDNSAGAAQQMAETQLDNLAGDVTLLQSATEGFYIAVSDALTPALRGLTQFGTNNVLPFLTEGVKNFDKMAPAVITLAAAIAFLGGKKIVFRELAKEQGIAAASAKALGLEFETLKNREKVAAIATNGLKTALNGLKTAAPILILTALVEAGTLLYDAWKKDQEQTQKLTSATQGLISAANGATVKINDETGAIESLGTAIQNVDIDGLIEGHNQLAESLSESATEAASSQAMLSEYERTIAELGDGGKLSEEKLAELNIAVKGVNEALGTSYEVTGDSANGYKIMADGVEVAKESILDLIEAQKKQIQAEVDLQGQKDVLAQLTKDNEELAKAKSNVAETSEKLRKIEEELNSPHDISKTEELKGAYAELERQLEQYNNEQADAQALVDASQSAYNKHTEKVKLDEMAMLDNASAVVQAAAANLDYRSGVQSAEVDLVAFTQALEEHGYTAEQVANMSQDEAMALAQAWREGSMGMQDAAQSAAETVPNAFNNMGTGVYNATKNVDKQAAKAINDGAGEITKAAQNATSGAEKQFESVDTNPQGEQTGENYAQGIESKQGEASSAANQVANAAASSIGSQTGAAENSGRYFGQGFANGMSAMSGAVREAARRLAHDALESLKKEGGEGSPWKKTERSGKFAAQGLIRGLKKSKKNVKKSAKEMASVIVDAANKRMSNLKGINAVTVEYEIGFWKRIKAKTKKGSDGWYEASKKLLEAKKAQKEGLKKADNDIISNANTWLERYKLTHNLSLQAEERYWKKYIKKVKKGSDAYYTALKNLTNIQSKIKQENAKKDSETLSKAEKWLGNYQVTHNTSLKYEERYWSKYLKKVKKGSDEWYAIRKKLNDVRGQMDADTLSKAEKWLDHYQTLHNTSLKYEEKYWKKYLKKVKKGSDEWYEIQKNLNDIRDRKAEELNQKYDNILDSANNYISRQRRLYTMSYKQEVDYWKKILKKLKKGTEQYKEAYDNYLEAKKNANEEQKEKNADLLSAEQDYVDKLRSIQKQLTDDIQAAKDQYLDAVRERKNAILSDMNTFEVYRKKVTISGEKLIENLQKQVAATKDYEQGMKQLESRIGKGELLDEIKAMGTDGLRYAESLNQMSDDQLKEFVRLYKERNDIAQREATRQSKDQLDEMNQTISDLNKQAAKDMNDASKELKSIAAELNTSLSSSVAKMASNVKASANSISQSIESAISSLKKLDSRVSTTGSSTRSYSISQPQGEPIPVPTVYNGRQVITDSTGAIQGYSIMASDLYGVSRQTELSLLRGMDAMTVAFKQNAGAGKVEVHQENNFNVPIETPDDVSRTMRMQERYGLAGRYI